MPTTEAIKQLMVPDKTAARLAATTNHLVKELRDNLTSLIVYGSAVRGGFDPRRSDINLLIVLKHSTPEAHSVIQIISAGKFRVNPMIIEHDELPSAARVFALKFMSIHRESRVLYGSDPLADIKVPVAQLAFLIEQELRNQRLRLIHAYVMSSRRPKQYAQYVMHHAKTILINLSDLLRVANIEVPAEYTDRVPVINEQIGVSRETLTHLIGLPLTSPRMSRPEAEQLHRKLLQLFRTAINWMEKQWPTPPT